MQRDTVQLGILHPEHHHRVYVFADRFTALSADACYLPHHGYQKRVPDRDDHTSGELRGHAVSEQPLDPHQRRDTVFRCWLGHVYSAGLGAAQVRKQLFLDNG